MLYFLMKSDDYRTRQTLLEKLRDRHDEVAWEEFVELYSRYIYALIKGMGFDHHDIEDLQQEVLLRAWRGLETFDYSRANCRFRSWLSIVCRNCVRNRLNSKAGKMARLADEFAGIEMVSDPEVEALATKEWRLHVTRLAWEAVQADFSEKVLDIYLELNKGREVSDIAAEFAVAESSLYVYRQRVQRALSKEILRLDRELG